jgi:hypothetical protein
LNPQISPPKILKLGRDYDEPRTRKFSKLPLSVIKKSADARGSEMLSGVILA